MSIRTAVAAAIAATLPPGSALASQGPGVGTGTASPQLQAVVALFIAGMAAFVVIGLVLLALGMRSRD